MDALPERGVRSWADGCETYSAPWLCPRVAEPACAPGIIRTGGDHSGGGAFGAGGFRDGEWGSGGLRGAVKRLLKYCNCPRCCRIWRWPRRERSVDIRSHLDPEGRDYDDFLGLFPLVPKLHLGTHLSSKLRFASLTPCAAATAFTKRTPRTSSPAPSSSSCPSSPMARVAISSSMPSVTAASTKPCAFMPGSFSTTTFTPSSPHPISRACSPILSATRPSRSSRNCRQDGSDWLLHQLSYHRLKHKSESEHQIWQKGSHPQAIVSDEMMEQKLEYLHNNPVKRGLVASPEHWRYSSAHE